MMMLLLALMLVLAVVSGMQIRKWWDDIYITRERKDLN